MNKCYRIIWNKVRNCYVVVSELVGNGRHKASRRRKKAATFSTAVLLAVSMAAPVTEAAEPYKILVDDKGNVVSGETVSSGTGDQTVQNSIAGGVYSISIGKGAETKKDYSAAIGAGNMAGGTGSFVFGDRNYTGVTPETTDQGVSYFRYQTRDGVAYAALDGSKIYTLADGTPCVYRGLPVLVGEDGQTYQVIEETGAIFKTTVHADGSISVDDIKMKDPVALEKVYGKLLTDKKIAGNGAVAFGKNNLAIGDYSLAYGKNSRTSGENATAFGYYAVANGKNSVAWGDHTTADYKIEYFPNGTTAYIKKSGGKNVYVNKDGVRLLTDAKGIPVDYFSGQPIPVGEDGYGYVTKYVRGKGYQRFKVTVNADGSVSIAKTPTEGYIAYQSVEGDFEIVENNTAFGKNTVASGNQATAWGEDNVASGDNATSWGQDNVASGGQATAWGEDTVASGWNATAWGMDSVASGESTTAWGEYSIAAGVRATAWGDESEAYGEDSTAFGDNSIAGGDNSLAALGGKTGVKDDDGYTDGRNSAAIGMDAWAKVNDSLALGSRSVADREAGQGADYQEHSGFDATTGKESTKTDSVWRSTKSAIAVGNPAENVTRQITGVAAGYEDTDAVNVAQLKEVRRLAGTQTILEAGPSGNITVTPGTDADGARKYTVDLAENVTFGTGEKQISVKGSDGTLTVGAGDKQVKLDGRDGSITAGGVTINKDKSGTIGGLTNKTWTEGTYTSGQAATEDQLHQVESNVNTKIKNVNEAIDKTAKQHTTVSVNGNKEKGNLVLTKTDATDTAGANYDISLSNEVTIGSTGASGKDGKLTVASQDGTKSIMADGKTGTLMFKNSQFETAIQVGSAVKGVDGAADIQRITTDGHTVATMDDGMKYSGDSGKAAVQLNKNVQIYGGATEYAEGNNIGVTASQEGDDARLQVRLARDLKGINSLEAGAINAKTVHSDTFQAGNSIVNDSGLTIKGDDKHGNITIHQDSINMGGNKIENVAPGRIALDSADAVNGSQLYETNQDISHLSGAVNILGSRVNRVGANAAALAALHPLDFDSDDKWDFAAGYGNYKDASAVAVGAYYRPDEDTMLSFGGSFGGGENMVNAGITWKFGQKNHVSRSRVSMAKEILSMKAQIEALTKKLAAYESGQPVKGPSESGSTTAFPDVPENHWAYQYVRTLAARGYLQGYPDGKFKGDRTMTRYEYAAIIYWALQNGAPSDGDMVRSVDEIGPELVKVQSIDRFRVDRISGKDTDRHKVERIRINDKGNRRENEYRDLYGSHIVRQSVGKS